MNPIKRIRKELTLSRDTLAQLSGMTYPSIAANEKGRYKEPSKKILDVFEKLGYDREQVKQEYIQWREQQRLAV